MQPSSAHIIARPVEKGGRATLGRSRGGFSTKINARTNADGLPIGIEITPGQRHDVTAYPALMDDLDCDPEQMLGDKGYDSEAIRRDIEQRGGQAVIPSLASRKIQHAVDKLVPCATASNASSIAPRTHTASPTDTISSSRAFRLSCCWHVFASGSGLSTRPSQPTK